MIIIIPIYFSNAKWHNCTSDYIRIIDERQQSPNQEQYDIDLEKHINLYTPQPQRRY